MEMQHPSMNQVGDNMISIMDIISNTNMNMAPSPQIPFNLGDQEIPRRVNENLEDNSLRVPLLGGN